MTHFRGGLGGSIWQRIDKRLVFSSHLLRIGLPQLSYQPIRPMIRLTTNKHHSPIFWMVHYAMTLDPQPKSLLLMGIYIPVMSFTRPPLSNSCDSLGPHPSSHVPLLGHTRCQISWVYGQGSVLSKFLSTFPWLHPSAANLRDQLLNTPSPHTPARSRSCTIGIGTSLVVSTGC